jgi:RNA-directed DNA polymerase
VENRLREIATTGERGDASGAESALPPAFAVNRHGLPVALFTLRQKLYLKAKREPTFRFYTLYDRIYRLDVLEAAWALVAANDGAPGVDGVTTQQIATAPGGAAALVATLHEELRTKRYRPQAIRRVFIPKADGRQRPLGIPTVRDRVVQTAALLILEPIFEADFRDCSYGYRPARQAHEALAAVLTALREGDTAIYDADLQAYFDTIPHDQLMQCVARRVADRSVLRLLRQWLTAPVEERDDDGRPRRRRPTHGTPQGGVISPLLANLYLHWFDVRFHRRDGPAAWAQARLIRYADDFVILAKTIPPSLVGWVEGTVEGWLGLTINRVKTRVLTLAPDGEESVTFLGYTFRYERDRFGRAQRYLVAAPSVAAVGRCRAAVRRLVQSSRGSVPVPVLIEQVNRMLRGWGQYFSFGYPRRAHRAVNAHVVTRLTKHLQRRSQRPCRPPAEHSWYRYLTTELGLVLL